MSGVRTGRVSKHRRGHRMKTRPEYLLLYLRVSTNTSRDSLDGWVEGQIQKEVLWDTARIVRRFLSLSPKPAARVRPRFAAGGTLVLRMMAIMQDRKSEEVPKEFLETGRTGRRNAMPDILHPQGAECTTADLPSRLQQLATTDTDNPQPCSSKSEHELNKEDESSVNKDCS